MTTVVDPSLSGGGSGKQAGRARGKNPWNRLWQIPLLLAGLAAFGFGLKALVKTIKPVPFETHIGDVRNLLATDKFDKAIERINTLGDYYKDRTQQAELQRLAGDAHYLSQQKQPAIVRANFQQVADHYRKAVLLGAQPSAVMNERWGEAALALGDAPMAIEKLEAAGAEDPERLIAHVRDLVAAYAATGQGAKALDAVQRVLQQHDLTVDDRAWGLCKKIDMAMEEGGVANSRLEPALEEARKALPHIPERDPAGRILTWIGRAEYEQGKLDDAQRDLLDARSRFLIHNLDDGRATLLLGRIAQAKGHIEEAGKLYQEVVTGQAGTSIWPAARLGRAEVLAAKGETGEQMQVDYRYAIQTVLAMKAEPTVGEGKGTPEMIGVDLVRASLVAQYQRNADENKLDAALLFLTLQGELKEKETAASTYRVATAKEGRAAQLFAEMRAMPESDQQGRHAKKTEAVGLLEEAAEEYLKHAKLTTMEDVLSGNSLWRAAQLLDEAGKTMRAIETYERFVVERPRDARGPEGLLAIGRLYQSVAMLEKAIATYERNIKENPRTPSAYTSTVNLARCYMNQGPEHFEQAEKALLSLVQGNLDLLPTANEFRVSLFTLGELYYRNGRWADAILRLEECVERYPEDRQLPSAMFMLAESYRKSALEVGEALKKDPGIEHREGLVAARVERLQRASALFGRVIGALDTDPTEALAGHDPHLSQLEESYLRSSYMDRAECAFELEDYAGAIKLYDQTATRFAQQVAAIEAYVQVVNAYLAMNQPRQASAAAERAQWILKRIPDEEFGKGQLGLNRDYYEGFLKLAKK